MDAAKIHEFVDFFDSDECIEAFNDIGKLKREYRDKFIDLFNRCDVINGQTQYEKLSKEETTRLKGQYLETLLKATFEYTGNYFETYENLGTNTNEIDLLLRLTKRGRLLCPKVLNEYYKTFICECKNYKKPVDVTYIGKFYSLMQVSSLKLGIMVSWKGVGGKGWEDGKGLIKKICMSKECIADKTFILDFNKTDFQRLIDGETIFDIIDKKYQELLLDISFDEYIKKHPNEDELERKISNLKYQMDMAYEEPTDVK